MKPGDVFGGWEVIAIGDYDPLFCAGKHRPVRVRCRHCGGEFRVQPGSVVRNVRGCLRCASAASERARLSVAAGNRFGRWTVLEEVSPAARHARVFRCRCECGRERAVTLGNLRGGKSRGCASCARRGYRKPGAPSRHPLFQTWHGMLDRCRDPAHPAYGNYGARGVTVCERWNDFDAFCLDVGPRPDGTTLDRVDPFGNYEPGNCRWADRWTQARNRRVDKRHVISGEPLTLQQIADRVGMTREGIRVRIRNGWTPDEAATFPRGAIPDRVRAGWRPKGRPRRIPAVAA